MQTTAPLSTMMSRRRHERTLLSQCARGTTRSRGMRALASLRGRSLCPPGYAGWVVQGAPNGRKMVKADAAGGDAERVRLVVRVVVEDRNEFEVTETRAMLLVASTGLSRTRVPGRAGHSLGRGIESCRWRKEESQQRVRSAQMCRDAVQRRRRGDAGRLGAN